MQQPTGILDARTLAGLLQKEVLHDPKGSGRTGLPVAWASTRGSVRENNQDRLLIAHGPTGIAIAAIADGMGGMKDGARAAVVAVSAAVAHCVASPAGDLQRVLMEALRFANDEVFALLRGDGGAVIALAAWHRGDRYVAHAGDARAYLIQGNGQLKLLTVDDTVRAQLRKQGRPSAQESELHTQLLQFIGVGRDLEPHVLRVPDGGRGLLLTSDGIHGGMPSAVMEWTVETATGLHEVVERLVQASEWNGGRDNATVVAVSFQNGYQTNPRFVDFWSPGGHLVAYVDSMPAHRTQLERPQRTLLLDQAANTLPAGPPISAQPSKTRGKKKPARKQTQHRRGANKEHDVRERQVPIVQFDDPLSSRSSKSISDQLPSPAPGKQGHQR